MATVRELTPANGDDIIRAVGGLSTWTHGTYVALIKRLSTGSTHNVIALTNTASAFPSGALQINFDLFYYNEHWDGMAASAPTAAANVWWLVVGRKVSGAAVPRFSIKNVSTGVWTHGNAAGGSFTVGDARNPVNQSVRFSSNDGANRFHGRVAALAAWANTLPWTANVAGDTAIEAAGLDTAYQNWIDNNPTAAWKFNQADVSTPVVDDAGNGANQTSVAGTTVVSDGSLTFNYTLGAAPTPANTPAERTHIVPAEARRYDVLADPQRLYIVPAESRVTEVPHG